MGSESASFKTAKFHLQESSSAKSQKQNRPVVQITFEVQLYRRVGSLVKLLHIEKEQSGRDRFRDEGKSSKQTTT